MAKAKKADELIITTPNEVGTLSHITDALFSSGISILHLSAYARGESAYFMVITDNNEKAAEMIKDMGYKVINKQALIIEFENRPGALAPVAKKLSDNGIDIEYIFATSADGRKVLGIISTNNDDMAFELINE